MPVTRLDQIFRQAAESAIITNAHRINQGEMPLTGEPINDFFMFTSDDAEAVAALIVDLVKGDAKWQGVQITDSETYDWPASSTYIQNPPYSLKPHPPPTE